MSGDIKIMYERATGLVVAKVAGRYEQSEAERQWSQIDLVCKANHTRFILFDARERDYDVDPSLAFAGFVRLAERAVGKTIATVHRDTHRDIGMAGMLAGESVWNEVRFFLDEEAARTWLCREARAGNSEPPAAAAYA
ncbi:hypothetical protein [Marinicauda pacifica]|uniref:STAS/SEC14 domain-containing protein n=1 Tax=Marinicauda pacifica TaxID=1133559 RepID=A0A4V3RZ93_9PROT|nr:hypothetical protein [Marinicauda pacifica]TGY93349.1 hypothetical protein E5162_09910 [Marinicauda pacifica]